MSGKLEMKNAKIYNEICLIFLNSEQRFSLFSDWMQKVQNFKVTKNERYNWIHQVQLVMNIVDLVKSFLTIIYCLLLST